MQLRCGLGGLHAAAARFAAAGRRPAPPGAPALPQARGVAAAAGAPSDNAAASYDGPTRGRLFLVDAKAQVYRLSHGYGDAARPQPAAGPGGGAPPPPPPPPGAGEEASLVAHGFIQILLNLFNMKPPPTHMAVVVDAPGANFRNLLYPAYKAQRSEAPAGLKEDLGRILDVVDALGVPILAVPGVEADDVIGSLAVRGEREGLEVTIVSPDKDFFQLLSPRVRLMRLIKAPKKLSLHPGSPFYTLEDFEAEHRLGDARLWADVMALQGDESDNVPGVRGVGAKTALRLVQACGGVDAVLADGAWEGVKLNKKQRAMLSSEDGRDAARLAKQLVTIATDLRQPPVTAPLESFRLRVPADGGAELMARMQYYGLQWSGKRVQQTLAAWAAAGGSPPLEADAGDGGG